MAADATHHRDLVVLGASAGGVEALRDVISGLPADLPAAVLAVLHMPARGDTVLAAILDRCGPLPARPARHGEALLPGQVYVAVPDHHLLVRDGCVQLSRAAKQNRARPAVDALFRSAARWSGARTVAAVLSGSLDDGAAGLAAVDAAGGVCMVQDPADALFPGMPRAALAVVPDALVCGAGAMGQRIRERAAGHVAVPATPFSTQDLIVETDMAEDGSHTDAGERPGRPAALSCPDCTGGMNVVQTGAAVHFTCHTGHMWSPQSLLAAQQERVEQALWTAVSIMEEQASVHGDLARRAASTGSDGLTEKHQRAAAEEIRMAVGVIRKHFPEYVLPV
ncbi:two-component system chemotaxis response regulator CheB [Catenuloplanes nepalensis]|uniref:protein-glutamate methylesterase n=1 Tax=Catenuloplanes nepalensis TaxID=587533 RepID=A0ABT9N7N9_9ACTN|nr:chemotaxis protein CheB [Catenuloplanes nepalensis]MDP9799426.1 two-component system chemotaxis response regulator CheB [Catenuloplanes nepalensis]